jgi:hypothetical protein
MKNRKDNVFLGTQSSLNIAISDCKQQDGELQTVADTARDVVTVSELTVTICLHSTVGEVLRSVQVDR